MRPYKSKLQSGHAPQNLLKNYKKGNRKRKEIVIPQTRKDLEEVKMFNQPYILYPRNLFKNYKKGDRKKKKSLFLKREKTPKKSKREKTLKKSKRLISRISSISVIDNPNLPTTLYQDKYPSRNGYDGKNKLLLETLHMFRAYLAILLTKDYLQPSLQEEAPMYCKLHEESPYFLALPTASPTAESDSSIMEHDYTAMYPHPLPNHFMIDLTTPIIVPKVLSMITVSICLSKKIPSREQVGCINDSSSHVKVTASKLIPNQQKDRNIQSANLFIKGCIQHTLKYSSREPNNGQFNNLRYIDTNIPFICCTTITFPASNGPIVMPTVRDDDTFGLSPQQGTCYGQVHCELIAYTTDEMIVIKNIERDEQLHSPTQQLIIHMSMSIQLKLELTQQQQVVLCKLKSSREK